MIRSLLVVLVFVGCLLAAPVPVRKSPAKPQTVREGILAARHLNWNSGDSVRFHGDGGYEWRSGSSTWVGTWQMTGPATLAVREAPLNEGDGTLGDWINWNVELHWKPRLVEKHSKDEGRGNWSGDVQGGFVITVRLESKHKMP